MPGRFLILLPLIDFLAVPIVQGEDPREVERSIRAQYSHKVFILRNPCRGKQLEYNSDGALTQSHEAGPWTLYGNIRIDRVDLRQNQLKIEGTRIFLQYDQIKNKFAEFSAGDVHLVVNLDSAAITLDSLTGTMKKIFISHDEPLADAVPTFWKDFLMGISPEKGAKEEGTDSLGEPIYKFDKGTMVAPKEILAPSPNYSEEARHAGCQGTLALSIVVNSKGRVEDVSITHPLGMGLDENTVDTVQGWRFKPSLRDGIPIAVRVELEVSFSLGIVR